MHLHEYSACRASWDVQYCWTLRKEEVAMKPCWNRNPQDQQSDPTSSSSQNVSLQGIHSHSLVCAMPLFPLFSSPWLSLPYHFVKLYNYVDFRTRLPCKGNVIGVGGFIMVSLNLLIKIGNIKSNNMTVELRLKVQI